MTGGIEQLLRIGRNTRDLDRAVAFYCDALGFQVVAANAPPPTWTYLPGVHNAPSPSRCAQLLLGAQQVELTEFPGGAPYPGGGSSSDLAFQHCAIVVANMDAAHERVMAHGAAPITRGDPETLPPSAGSVTAFKFRDPDGHPLELIHFPEGVGDPVWQSTGTGAIALGIDHSAISVADTARSIVFYQALGLRVTSPAVNRGPEQQRLDALKDAAVDIVPMQPANSRIPHLELLGYHHPRASVTAPDDFTAVAADRVIWRAEDIHLLLYELGLADFTGAVITNDSIEGTTMALLRDPDGHLLVLTEA